MNDFTELKGLQDYPLARRGVLMTGLIGGFTLAAQRVEAQAIQRPSIWSFTLTPGTASTPITVQATSRPMPRTPGSGRRRGSTGSV